MKESVKVMMPMDIVFEDIMFLKMTSRRVQWH